MRLPSPTRARKTEKEKERKKEDTANVDFARHSRTSSTEYYVLRTLFSLEWPAPDGNAQSMAHKDAVGSRQRLQSGTASELSIPSHAWDILGLGG